MRFLLATFFWPCYVIRKMSKNRSLLRKGEKCKMNKGGGGGGGGGRKKEEKGKSRGGKKRKTH